HRGPHSARASHDGGCGDRRDGCLSAFAHAIRPHHRPADRRRWRLHSSRPRYHIGFVARMRRFCVYMVNAHRNFPARRYGMKHTSVLALAGMFGFCMIAVGQQPGQPQFKIDSTNRTLSVSASGAVEMEPDIAILHVGFETQPQDSKSAYADGARISNAIVNAIKQAGVADAAIHSESQYLNRDFDNKQHRYRLTQTWTVKVSPERAAEILDIAVNAGANTSGEIDWTVKDEKALEQQALEKAATLAREN